MGQTEDNFPMPSNEQDRTEPSNKDISFVLRGWDYEPGTINVRKIGGADGSAKLQMRLDLGLLQMEMSGRPDGRRPHGHESLLKYHEAQLDEHKRVNGSELGFHLTRPHCQQLREEAMMYYQRYISLFVLEEFGGVVRDTARNLRVLDLCGRYAVDEHDRVVLEQFRPYITMMNTRAAASLLMREKRYDDALARVKRGLRAIKAFFVRFGQEQAYPRSTEVKLLRRMAREIKKRQPVDPIRQLNKDLAKAVAAERYEDAARIRDELARLPLQSPEQQQPPAGPQA